MGAEKRLISGLTAAALSLICTAVPMGSGVSRFVQDTAITADADVLTSVGASVRPGKTVTELTYDRLRECVTDVADGKLNSTVFSVTMEDLGYQDQLFSAEELGIDAVVSNGYITTEAQKAANELINCDRSWVMYKLQADCPYELFWFDKVSGMMTYTKVSLSATYDSSKREYLLGLNGEIQYSVSGDYGVGEHTVDQTQVNRAKSAKAKADEIVAKYASAGDSEKLEGYRKEICSLVTYNNAAAGGGAAYGDPWQMTYVFDGDPGTNVVCEGYSKAFKYLCDKTAFSSKKISCITATGMMSSSTAYGNHMWNIVRLDDGNNYLADITNCDSGSIGADDLLFLKPFTSGDPDSGYVYDLRYASIKYVYDNNTKLIFGNDWLDLSERTPVFEPDDIKVNYTAGDGEVLLKWNDANAAEQYAVCGFVNKKWQILATTNDTYYVLKGLTAGTNYKVAVLAMYGGEWYSDFTNAIVVTPKAAAQYPTVTSVDCNEQYHQFRISWTSVPNAQNYGVAVYLAGKWKVQKQDIAPSVTSFTSPKLTPGKTYKLVVAAKVGGVWDLSSLNSRIVTVTIK